MALGFLATKARPDVLTLALPADLVSGLIDAVGHLESSAAGDRRPALAALASDLAARPPRVTAPLELLRELVAVAIDGTSDRVGAAAGRLLRGEGSAGEVRELVAELSGLLDLLDAVDARAGRGTS